MKHYVWRNRMWKLFFIYELSIFNAYLNIVICWSLLLFFLSKLVIFLYEKNVHVSHFARRKDSRIPRGWMRLTYWKGMMLFLAEQRKRMLDLCRLNETTNAALSFANDVKAVADSTFGSILFAIWKVFFFRRNSADDWYLSFRLNFL